MEQENDLVLLSAMYRHVPIASFCQPLFHCQEILFFLLNADESTIHLNGNLASRANTRESIKHHIARIRTDCHKMLNECFWLLGRMKSFIVFALYALIASTDG